MSRIAKAFVTLGEIATNAKARRQKENQEFLDFYRNLLEVVPMETCMLFGSAAVGDLVANAGAGVEIELTLKDYFWWKRVLEKDAYFPRGIEHIKRLMLHHLAEKIEKAGITDEERHRILCLVDPLRETPVDM